MTNLDNGKTGTSKGGGTAPDIDPGVPVETGRPDDRSHSATTPNADAAGEAERIAEILQHLENPAVRARLAEVIAEELDTAEERKPIWKRIGPWIASASSALIMVLAFFLPSVEDQWDRYQARRVIQRHVELGRSFMRDGQYKLAVDSFAKAFELSENKRLDIEEERLKAKVYAVNANPTWGVENPEGLSESEIVYLLKLESGPDQANARSATLNAYGTFLASEHRDKEAEAALREATSLDPKNAEAHVSLGNLMRTVDRLKDAEASYRAALSIDGDDSHAWYDLGLVLSETGRSQDAEEAFRKAVLHDPEDAEALRALAGQLETNGRNDEARRVREQAGKIEAATPKLQQQTPKFEEPGG
jgi:Flp pilus assembly protein TadD